MTIKEEFILVQCISCKREYRIPVKETTKEKQIICPKCGVPLVDHTIENKRYSSKSIK